MRISNRLMCCLWLGLLLSLVDGSGRESCSAQNAEGARAPRPARQLPALLTPEEARKPEAQPPGIRQNPVRGGDALRPVPVLKELPVKAVPIEKAAWRDRVLVPADLDRLPVGFDLPVGIVALFSAQNAESAGGGEPAAAEVSAALNTSEELERLLDRADQIVAAGRPDLAPVLWQRVLDEGAGTLATQAGGVQKTLRHTYQRYRPLQEEAERRIVAAGADGLRQYRLNSDGRAQALLAGGAAEERERTLAEIVRRYFLTTIGDDAAFELGCRQLERREYTAAAQWLSKLHQYPDSQIARDQVVVRLAVALSRIGSRSAAEQLLVDEARIDEELKRQLLAAGQHDGARDTHAPAGGWSMFHGNAARTGLMPSVERADWDQALRDAWEYRPNFTLKGAPPPPQGQRTGTTIINGRRVRFLIGDNGQIIQPGANDGAPDIALTDLAARWQAAGWQPAGELLFADGRLLLKAEDRVVCCEADTGKVLWMGRKTKFPLNADAQQTALLAAAGWTVQEEDSGDRPKTFTEHVLFGDRAAQSMTIAGDLVLNVEGALDYLKARPDTPQDPNQALQMMLRGVEVQEGATGRQNWLAAYELRTGKLRWHRAAGDGEAAGGAFLCAPLPLGGQLLVAVGDDTRISVAALDRETGATRWRVVLCDTPVEGRVAQAPVGLAAEEGDVYVSTGAGAVFALDALSGSVKWAAAYPRKLPKHLGQAQALVRAMQGGEATPGAIYSRAEFRDNLVLRHGHTVVVAASDFDYLFALDAHSGMLRWEAPLAPAGPGGPSEYYLGVLDGKLFLGGTRSVRRYDLQGGRLEWESPLQSSCGRGLLTRVALYVPEQVGIVRFDPVTGERLGATRVLAPDDAPVGNLFSDGSRLYAVGAARVSALGPVARQAPEGAQ